MGSFWSWCKAALHSLPPHRISVGCWIIMGSPIHAFFSGCDTVSAFHGVGKKIAWYVWCSMRHLKPVFYRLSKSPSHVSSEDMDEIERYVVLLYQRTSSHSKVIDARKRMFASGNRKIENIPPTTYALEQHVKRAVHQAGHHVWGQCLQGDPTLPSPAAWGWERTDDNSPWTPCWTTLSEASKACQELLRCGCKKACTKRCKCFMANLKCTQLCFCAGQCSREWMNEVCSVDSINQYYILPYTVVLYL
jgi:hypothetical protein